MRILSINSIKSYITSGRQPKYGVKVYGKLSKDTRRAVREYRRDLARVAYEQDANVVIAQRNNTVMLNIGNITRCKEITEKQDAFDCVWYGAQDAAYANTVANNRGLNNALASIQ